MEANKNPYCTANFRQMKGMSNSTPTEKNVTAHMQILFLPSRNSTRNFIYSDCWFRDLLTAAGCELQLLGTSCAD